MNFVSAGKTDVGSVRKNNEDSLLIDDALGLFVVADGMGGQESGEVASRVALRALHDFIVRGEVAARREKLPMVKLGEHLKKAIEVADEAVRKIPHKGHSAGTTLTALWMVGSSAVMAHVGDSRLYRLQDEVIEQLSLDHSFTAIAVRKGMLTPEKAATHAMRNTLMNSLGGRNAIEVDVEVLDVEPDDTFLLCSDGLTEYLDDDELENVLMAMDLKGIAQRLVNIANDRGGEDNITVVLVRVSGMHVEASPSSGNARLPTLMDYGVVPRPVGPRDWKKDD